MEPSHHRFSRPEPVSEEQRAWEEAEQEWRDSKRFTTRRFRTARPAGETRGLGPRFRIVRYWALIAIGLLLLGLAVLWLVL